MELRLQLQAVAASLPCRSLASCSLDQESGVPARLAASISRPRTLFNLCASTKYGYSVQNTTNHGRGADTGCPSPAGPSTESAPDEREPEAAVVSHRLAEFQQPRRRTQHNATLSTITRPDKPGTVPCANVALALRRLPPFARIVSSRCRLPGHLLFPEAGRSTTMRDLMSVPGTGSGAQGTHAAIAAAELGLTASRPTSHIFIS